MFGAPIRPFLVLATWCLVVPACGDDSGNGGGTETGTVSTTDGESASTTAATEGTSTGGVEDTTTGTTADTDSATTATSGATDTDTDTDTGGVDCSAILPGPIEPVLFTMQLSGSEDLAFDGAGHLAGKKGTDVVLIDADDQAIPLASGVPQAYGLRFHGDGNLLVALPNADKIVQVTPTGEVSDFVTGIDGPNGIFPDLDGNVWVTAFSGSQVLRIDGDKNKIPIVTGAMAQAANGVVYDPDRKLLFYTNYQSGIVRRVEIDDQGDSGAVTEVGSIPGAPDGLVLDACGNLYVVDQQNSDLYRFWLDRNGVAMEDEELVASFQSNVANVQFGRGDGFDAESLYAAGNPGSVWRVAVGVTGAAIP